MGAVLGYNGLAMIFGHVIFVTIILACSFVGLHYLGANTSSGYHRMVSLGKIIFRTIPILPLNQISHIFQRRAIDPNQSNLAENSLDYLNLLINLYSSVQFSFISNIKGEK